MTKLKPALSEGDALSRITGPFPGGIKAAAKLVSRDPSTLYRWSDPDLEDSIPLSCAIILDRAHRQAGGLGSPLLEYFAAQLELADAERIAEHIEVHRLAADMNRAAGEANAELAELALPGATEEDWREAERDVSTLYQKITTLLPLLRRGRAKPQQQPP
ncbi:hypothetical protein CA223_05360 [Sphingomonas koreensis]|uniref:Uncharacterized protein n=1 Tax=Sphingomonas koreensis TaxID=93064 RepID=A0A1L6JBM4_9SPHN|nr:hypothetical protein [Sphingomonas koreensis]APR53344.1 hypothetical protein BRX40_13715 [Sphingomonas koreensis]MDC7809964.1 hypothetical protein [Sphingomonas koreensis]RSU24536.1 hypothetical protein CA224_02120 [Sphingomonas koreensis]RSU25181.1 hypothetical protein CA222_13715 [Sphingomonas koreensis]RSU30144.1 hypothetical protein CA225_05635 [Sphingomonas koreensis]